MICVFGIYAPAWNSEIHEIYVPTGSAAEKIYHIQVMK